MSLRQASMSDLEGMKEAAWENVHGGEDWEPIVEGQRRSSVAFWKRKD